jgi:SH3 domain protein
MTGRLIALCLLALASSAAGAETRYVSDQLEITLRTGTSTQNTIIRMLPSGTRLETLEVDEASGYTRVRGPNGVEGWVLTRYLMNQPAARDQLAAANSRVQSLTAQVTELTEQVETLRKERDALGAERSGLGAELGDVQTELERIRRASASALELDKANRELRTRLAAAEQAGDGLRAEISELKRNTQRDWFLAGAGVLVLGLILGLVLPRMRMRRRSGWGDL